MKKNKKELEPVATIEESEYVSISTFFKSKDLLKDGTNLNTKLNPENHYFQHVHRLDPEAVLPFYYVIHFDGIQYKGGPYKDIYNANRECAKKMYDLYGLDQEELIIECERPKVKKDEDINK